jgi:hypothetical protein
MEQVPEQIPDDDSDLVIRLEGAINPVNPDSRAAEPVMPAEPMPLTVLRADADAVGESPKYNGGYAFSVNAKLDTDGKVIWESGATLRYPKDGRYTKLIFLSPMADEVNLSAKTITYKDFDGETEIMCSDFLQGNKTNTITEMVLDHKLTQVKVFVKGEDASSISEWGKVTGITITDKAGDVVVTADPKNGSTTLRLADGSKTALTVPNSTVGGVSFSTTEAEYGVVKFVPSESAEPLEFNVTTQYGGAKTLSTETLRSYEAANAYKITIEFKNGGDVDISIDGGIGNNGSMDGWTDFDGGATVETIEAD